LGTGPTWNAAVMGVAADVDLALGVVALDVSRPSSAARRANAGYSRPRLAIEAGDPRDVITSRGASVVAKRA
jgi:hypothetical protein